MRAMLFLAVLFAGAAQADANSDAFNAGAAFGKGSSSQGTSSLSNPGAVTGSIPGYTSSPSESGYYGGVTGGDGGLSDKGQAALQNSDAGQAIIDSGTTNKPPVIDPSAPYITAGKSAESTAGSVLDGTGSQCTSTSVSKSTFENYQCDRDVNAFSSCSRTATIALNETQVVKDIDTSASGAMTFNYTLSQTGTIKSARVDIGNIVLPYLVMCNKVSGDACAGFEVPVVSFLGQSWPVTVLSKPSKFYSTNGAAAFSVTLPGLSVQVLQGQVLPVRITYKYYTYKAEHGHGDDWETPVANYGDLASGYATVTLTVNTTVITKEPYQKWTTSCPGDAGIGTQVSSNCTTEPQTRTQVIDGVTYSLNASCWAYEDDYVSTGSVSTGTCASLTSDAACTQASKSCTEYTSGYCSHESVTYQCQKTYSSGGLVCGGQYFCQSGDCSDTDGAGDSGFDTAVAKLAGLASAGDDVVNDQINIKAFTGEAMSCRKAFAGFSNCCKDSGWGSDAGLANCNSDEMALGKAKAKKVTVSVGDLCDHQVLGVCIQKSQVYCVFGGKLARIIQEQGRRDQLGIGFGSGDSPNCSGITVPQLQGIDFDLINFADFYEDLMNNQKIPDTNTMVSQIKDRIAAQVQQQQSGAAK